MKPYSLVEVVDVGACSCNGLLEIGSSRKPGLSLLSELVLNDPDPFLISNLVGYQVVVVSHIALAP